VAEWLASGRQPPAPPEEAPAAPVTVNELLLRYHEHVKSYYVKNGKATSEQAAVRHVLGFLRRLYGSTAAAEFSPNALKAVRRAMIEHKISRTIKGKVVVLGHGLCRRTINKHVSRIKRMFAWAVEEELLPAGVHQALLRVKGLKKGKTAAREKPRVKPVPEASVDAVLPLVPKTIRAMIQVQQLCGGRPQDVVVMRAIDIDMTGPIWEYHPGRYKTEHFNDDDNPDKERVVFLGPRAQALLRPYLSLSVTDYLFSPIRSEQARLARVRQRRRSPVTPSQARRRPSGRRKAPLRDHYDAASYRRAIRRACKKAGIPNWHPNQLRHSRLTEIRKEYGLEAARTCAGHGDVATTQHYAEQNRTLALRVMAEIG
jgi:integrase